MMQKFVYVAMVDGRPVSGYNKTNPYYKNAGQARLVAVKYGKRSISPAPVIEVVRYKLVEESREIVEK